jgi:hypothetical protein
VNESLTYYNSDAWVLLAIIYANRKGNGTLDNIVAAGEAISIAIFLPSELAVLVMHCSGHPHSESL